MQNIAKKLGASLSLLRPKIKEVLGLPTYACNAYLYGSTDDGLFGIPLAGFDSDVSKIDSAFKLLMSNDKEVRDLAWEDLELATHDRINRTPTIQDVQDFLSNERYNETTNRVPTIWSNARIASRSNRLNIKWHFSKDKKVTLLKDDTAITDKSKVFSTMRNLLRKEQSNILKSKKSQGKTLECFAADKASNHFNRTGDFLRFADWRFIHAARTNTLLLNATIPGDRDNSEKLCRWCNKYFETLPHVLNNCDQMYPYKP